MNNSVAVIDFGSQYSQLIIRRIRELGYFSYLYEPNEIHKIDNPSSIILSGGPSSINEPDAPDIDFEYLLNLNIPVLGICYGMQLLNKKFGGKLKPQKTREYGHSILNIKDKSEELFKGLSDSNHIWMSHSDTVSDLPENSKVIGTNEDNIPVAIKWNDKFFGIQFHPEVSHTDNGINIIKNFLNKSSNLKEFKIDNFKDDLIHDIKEKVGSKEVICAVSGGVDSSVLSVLLSKANVKTRNIFINNGLLRENEEEEVSNLFKKMGIKIEVVDASEEFLEALTGVTDPEKKRLIIGELFVKKFFEATGNKIELLSQGTLYPDVIESATSNSKITSTIKTHHNRVEKIIALQKEGKVIEPLNELFKDEVRELGLTLGLPKEVINRHPFPGPGLAVRCPGEVTREKLAIIRQSDKIFIKILKDKNLYDSIWQAYVCLIPIKTVGVKGDERSYEYALSLRAVTSTDAMTAKWVHIPYEILEEISKKILNEIHGVNRVLYDISTKPPASIEWE